ncbi:MAG: HNH endonuclease [Synergistaceae bacterium]|nr:HNH endonuclease [Synergistaceae bacterium]
MHGKHLRCEVCGFDFGKAYSELGAGYIEVHHKKPISDGERITNLNEYLVMLCSNCHRMIHRGKDHMITVDELRKLIGSNAQQKE